MGMADMPGHASWGLDALRGAILATQQMDLDHLLDYLLDSDSSWLCLANAAAPDGAWLTATE